MTHDVGIYAITNKVNGHKYIGSACSLRAREGQHFRSLARGRHHSVYLQRAFDKYGSDAFNFAPIIYCGRENLLTYEQAAMDAMKPEYNIAQVAGSQLGYKHTAESRKRMSIARRRNPSSPRKGMKNSEESKRKVSETKTGVKMGPYSRERVEKSAAWMRASKSVLDEAKVRRIRALKRRGYSAPKVAEIIGCTHHVVYDICRGRTWGWVV